MMFNNDNKTGPELFGQFRIPKQEAETMKALIVRFKSGLSFEELLKRSNERADKYRAIDGLIQKYYLRYRGDGEYGAVYLWESQEALEKFRSSNLAGTIAETYQTDGDLDLQLGEVVKTLRPELEPKLA